LYRSDTRLMSTDKRELIFLGAAGTSLDVLGFLGDGLWRDSEFEYEGVGFLDDDASKWGMELDGLPVLGPLAGASKFQDAYFINGLASPSNFLRLNGIVSAAGIPIERFQSFVHPNAFVSRTSTLGTGSIVYPGVKVLSHAAIGDLTTILSNSVINHHVTIESHTTIASNVSLGGHVSIGDHCYIGSGSTVIQRVHIGSQSMIGMGSVVLRDVAPKSIAVGNPARLLKTSVND
jgi:sugar O-acyltransferase (sialic acid O-acetyltransferase NeuD family)